MPNVLSPRDLVFSPDNIDETVPHIIGVPYMTKLFSCKFGVSAYYMLICSIQDYRAHEYIQLSHIVNY